MDDTFLYQLFSTNSLIVSNRNISEKNIYTDEKENNFSKKNLVVLSQKASKEENEMLENMMKACKIDNDFLVVVHSDINLYIENFKGDNIVFFANENQFEEKFLNKPFKKNDKIIILTYPLKKLLSDKNLKSNLWTNALKIVYS